jgi:hypothetical protein
VFFSVAVDFQKDKYLHIIAQDQLGPIRGPFKSTVLFTRMGSATGPATQLPFKSLPSLE